MAVSDQVKPTSVDDSKTTDESSTVEIEHPSKKKVISWALWDWGTQPYATIITTFVFAVYLTSSTFGSENYTSMSLSIATAVEGLLIALLAPVLGQNADRSGHKVRNLKYLTWAVAVISASLFFVQAKPEYLWLGLILMGIGSIFSEIAGVNYNSLLEDVSTPKTIGRISGLGWGMGYLGGIVSLLVVYLGFIKPEVGPFGVTGNNGLDIRVSMIICGIWTFVFTIPTFLNLRDKPNATAAPKVSIWQSYKLLWESIVNLWNTSRDTLTFLLASALFRDGLAGVFAFGGVLAAQTFGMSAGQVIIFGVAANLVAGVSTIAFGHLDDKVGPKRVIQISLLSLVVLGMMIFFFHSAGTTAFWILGLAMCAFVGPAQSASRGFLTRITPPEKLGEMFGLYATTGRAVSFLSPAMFGVMIWVGSKIMRSESTQYWGIIGIVLVLLAGLLLMFKVKPHEEHSVS